MSRLTMVWVVLLMSGCLDNALEPSGPDANPLSDAGTVDLAADVEPEPVACLQAADCFYGKECSAENVCECVAEWVQCSPTTDCTTISNCPDGLDFEDTNSDGVDGVLDETIFISATGNDSLDGLSPQNAVKTPARALEIATQERGRSVLLFTTGEFPVVSTPDGLGNTSIAAISGGYDSEFLRRAAGPANTTWFSNTSVGPTLALKNSTLLLKTLKLGWPVGSLSTVTLALAGSKVTFDDVVIERGSASAGVDGSPGANGGSGLAGGAGRGGAAGCEGGNAGGDGGAGGLCSSTNTDTVIFPPTAGGSGDPSRPNGGVEGANRCVQADTARNGEDGVAGRDGDHGEVPGADGMNGMGGGGGGGGGASQVNPPIQPGRAGGGGGGGGCGGTAGQRGGQGGTSTAIYADQTSVLRGRLTVDGGKGGKGGNGGKAGCGGSGGGGQAGYAGVLSGTGSGVNVLVSGDGKPGGRGGDGAAGDGGDAGGLYALVYQENASFDGLTIAGEGEEVALGGAPGERCGLQSYGGEAGVSTKETSIQVAP